jgi:ribonuclease HI
MTVSVFAHAAGSKRRGPGGYGVIILAQDGQFEFSGHDESTDKRAMELLGLTEGLNALKPTMVRVSSSSEYVARAISQDWIKKWRRTGFKTAAGERIRHWRLWLDLAKRSSGMNKSHGCEFVAVAVVSTTTLRRRLPVALWRGTWRRSGIWGRVNAGP